MCKLFAASPVPVALEELERRVLKLDEENERLESIWKENVGATPGEFSTHVQIQTLQEIIEDYEQRCQSQDSRITVYIQEIAALKNECQQLRNKNKALRAENNGLKSKNHKLSQNLEEMTKKLKSELEQRRASFLSLSSCSTVEDSSVEEFEEARLEPCVVVVEPKKETKSLLGEFQEAVCAVKSEIKRLEIEGFEDEKEKVVTNFFKREPIRVPDLSMQSGFAKRNLALLKMKVFSKIGFGGLI